MPLRGEPVQERDKRIWSIHIQLAFPQEMIGGAVHYVPSQGWGGYGSLWLSTSRIDDETYYYEEIDPEFAELLGGNLIASESQWGGGRAGLTRRLSHSLYAYGGIGAMRSNNYLEYGNISPPTGSPEGQIWIDDPEPNSMRFILEIGGVYYTEGGIAFSLGLGTYPCGISFGLGFGNKL